MKTNIKFHYNNGKTYLASNVISHGHDIIGGTVLPTTSDNTLQYTVKGTKEYESECTFKIPLDDVLFYEVQQGDITTVVHVDKKHKVSIKSDIELPKKRSFTDVVPHHHSSAFMQELSGISEVPQPILKVNKDHPLYGTKWLPSQQRPEYSPWFNNAEGVSPTMNISVKGQIKSISMAGLLEGSLPSYDFLNTSSSGISVYRIQADSDGWFAVDNLNKIPKELVGVSLKLKLRDGSVPWSNVLILRDGDISNVTHIKIIK